MEQAIQGLFTTSFLVFALVIALLVSSFRKVVETLFNRIQVVLPLKVKNGLIIFWNQWVLRALPVCTGGFIAWVAPQYPYPPDFGTSPSAHIFFGLIAGLFSSTIYDLVKFHTRKYLPEDIKKRVDLLDPTPPEDKKEDPKTEDKPAQ